MTASARLAVSFVELGTPLDAADVAAIPGVRPPEVHTLSYTLLELDPRLQLALSDGLAIELLWPLRILDDRSRFEGGSEESLAPGLRAGPGDLDVALRIRLLEPSVETPLLVDLRAGVSLPVGALPGSPRAAGLAGTGDRGFSFGRGTVEPIVGLQLRTAERTPAFFAFAWIRGPVTSHASGFRAGVRSQLGGGLAFGRDVVLELAPSLYHETPDRFGDGLVLEGSGKTDLVASAAVTLFAQSDHPLELGANVPLTLRGTRASDHHSPIVITAELRGSFEVF